MTDDASTPPPTPEPASVVPLTPEASAKHSAITQNLQEVLGDNSLREILNSGRPLKVYWGTAPTGRPHIGYFVPMTKIGDLLRAGCDVTILFADIHAYLDNMKAPWDMLGVRTRYYESLIKAVLKSFGTPIEKLKFVRGSDYQLDKKFTLDVYKVSSLVTEHDAKKAGAEVVKQVEHPLLSGLLYPLLQALDEEYLGVDAQFGGVDQRKIFTFAEKYLPALGYSKRIHLMNPMVPGLSGSKMGSSDVSGKIDLLDAPEVVDAKIKRAFCEPGNVADNGLLSFAKMVLFPRFAILGRKFDINRDAKFGGPVSYATYQELHDAFAAKKLSPGDLKPAVAAELNKMLAPLREEFATPEMQKLIADAYPADKGNVLAQVAATQTEKLPKERKAPNAEGKKAGGRQAPAEDARPVDVSRALLVVGEIKSVEKHPDGDTLLVENVEFGPDRGGLVTIVSGLAKHYTPDQLLGKKAVFVRNMKPRKLKGVESCGMILAASDSEHKSVEVLFVPPSTPVGERVAVQGFPGEPEPFFNPKKDTWAEIAADLRTNDQRVAAYRGLPLTTSSGPLSVPTLVNAHLG